MRAGITYKETYLSPDHPMTLAAKMQLAEFLEGSGKDKEECEKLGERVAD